LRFNFVLVYFTAQNLLGSENSLDLAFLDKMHRDFDRRQTVLCCFINISYVPCCNEAGDARNIKNSALSSDWHFHSIRNLCRSYCL